MYQESVIHDVWWPCSWGQTQGRVSWRVFRSPRRDSQRWWWTGSRPSCGREWWLSRVETKSRSISTVEGSGATCTRIFFYFFIQNRWSFYGPVDPKNEKNSKKWKKRKKCIDITLRKWSWRPLWQVGKVGVWKNPKPFNKFTWWPVEASKFWCNFFGMMSLRQPTEKEVWG